MIGQFCWTDLLTNEVGSAQKFYSKILDWKYQSNQMPQGEYVFLNAGEYGVGGMMKNPNTNGPNAFWNTYFSVDSCNSYIKKVEDLGGKLLIPRTPAGDHGAWALVADPTGACFHLWESFDEIKNQKMADKSYHGVPSWCELQTTNVDLAAGFYQKLFNWQIEGDASYFEFSLNSKSFGGLCELDKSFGVNHSFWNVYFTVSDCDKAIKTTTENGGSIVVPKMQIPGSSSFIASLKDPQGAIFSIYQKSLA